MLSEAKTMTVKCDFAFCINNERGKCTLDKINLSIDGVCENSLDRSKIPAVETFLKKYGRLK